MSLKLVKANLEKLGGKVTIGKMRQVVANSLDYEHALSDAYHLIQDVEHFDQKQEYRMVWRTIQKAQDFETRIKAAQSGIDKENAFSGRSEIFEPLMIALVENEEFLKLEEPEKMAASFEKIIAQRAGSKYSITKDGVSLKVGTKYDESEMRLGDLLEELKNVVNKKAKKMGLSLKAIELS